MIKKNINGPNIYVENAPTKISATFCSVLHHFLIFFRQIHLLRFELTIKSQTSLILTMWNCSTEAKKSSAGSKQAVASLLQRRRGSVWSWWWRRREICFGNQNLELLRNSSLKISKTILGNCIFKRHLVFGFTKVTTEVTFWFVSFIMVVNWCSEKSFVEPRTCRKPLGSFSLMTSMQYSISPVVWRSFTVQWEIWSRTTWEQTEGYKRSGSR